MACEIGILTVKTSKKVTKYKNETKFGKLVLYSGFKTYINMLQNPGVIINMDDILNTDKYIENNTGNPDILDVEWFYGKYTDIESGQQLFAWWGPNQLIFQN